MKHVEDSMGRGRYGLPTKLEDHHLHCVVRMSRQAYDKNPPVMKRMALQDTAKQMALKIVQDKARERIREDVHYVDIELDVYVLTPGQIYDLIEDEVAKRQDTMSIIG